MKEEENILPGKDQLLSCDVCMKEIPHSAAQTSEGEEYIMYFCGLECYKKWKSTEQENKSDTK